MPACARSRQPALRAAAPGARVVVVGAGWIGLETAAAARLAGAEVTVLEAAELPLLRVLGREVARSSRTSTGSTGWTCGSGCRWPPSRTAGYGSATAPSYRRTPWWWASASPRTPGSRRRPGWPSTTGSAPTSTCAPRTRTCSRRVTSPTPTTRVRERRSGSSTGRTRSTSRRRPRNRCSGRTRCTTGCRTSSPTSTTWAWSTPATRNRRLRPGGVPRGRAPHGSSWRSGSRGRVLAGMNVNVWDVTDPIRDIILAGQSADAFEIAGPVSLIGHRRRAG